MNPVFYIGDMSREIHIECDSVKGKYIDIGIEYDSSSMKYTGRASRVIINGVNCTASYKDRIITYAMICELYEKSVNRPLKYKTMLSSRVNRIVLEQLLKKMTPDLRIDFLGYGYEPTKLEDLSVDDQIFKVWIGHV